MIPGPTRRERERLRHRQEILDAARKIAASHGIDGVTVEQVAREAEFAVGSIYRHFRSKDELVSELMVGLADRFLAELEGIVAGPDAFEDQLEHVVSLAHDRQIEILPILRALLAAPGPLPEPGSPGGDQLLAIRLRQSAVFDTLLARGQAEGAVVPGNRRPMVLALTGLIFSFSRAEMISGAPFEEDGPAHVIRILLGGVGRTGV